MGDLLHKFLSDGCASWPLCALLLGLSGVACGGAEQVELAPLHLLQVSPRQNQTLYLNESIELVFDGELEHSSVCGASFSIQGSAGEELPGDLAVEGRRLTFTPFPTSSPDLLGGSFQPDHSVTVVVTGFPAPDGLRSKQGRLLSSSLRLTWQTVSAESGGSLFLDRTPLRGHALELVTHKIRSLDRIQLSCAEPIDPTSLAPDQFELIDARASRRLALVARCAENFDRGAVRPRGTCLIELAATEALAVGDYIVTEREGKPPVRDYGGNPVTLPPLQWLPTEVQVVQSLEAARSEYWFETFEDTRLRSPIRVEGSDGTARWDDSGSCHVLFPKAAGSGVDGEVQLGLAVDSPEPGLELRSDLSAVTLSLAQGLVCRWEPGDGPAILRSQGLMRLSGRMTRRAGPGEPAVFPEGETLSDWLERTLAQGSPWTILVAGGDLILDGELDVDTPLLLAAGGTIRVTGTARAQEGQLWLLGQGGGLQLAPDTSRPPLLLDSPELNPLVAPLTYSILSDALPRSGRVRSWRSTAFDSRPGGGEVRVGFVPGDEPWRAPLADPRLWPEGGRLRLRIDLTVSPDPGAAWNPPAVDCVWVGWEEETR